MKMNSNKVGNFIKKIRKDNNLTQSEFGKKYGVTYQAVSKWENGINLPDIVLLKKISKDYNVSLDDILDGESLSNQNNKGTNRVLLVMILILIVVFAFSVVNMYRKSESFKFKTITTSCNEFEVSGSLAYDKRSSSIYISNINYCGGDDNNTYKEIECNLYEKDSDTPVLISSCKSEDRNITLEKYLENVKLNIDNYSSKCKSFSENSLYLEIKATSGGNKTIMYKVPLKLNDNCQK